MERRDSRVLKDKEFLSGRRSDTRVAFERKDKHQCGNWTQFIWRSSSEYSGVCEI